MQDTLTRLREYVAALKPEPALKELIQIFTLSDSELLNDAILVSAQYKKLQSDQRKGILDYTQENLAMNRINNSLVTLIDEIEAYPEAFRGVTRVEEHLAVSRADRGQDGDLPEKVQGALLSRITHYKQQEHQVKLLWLDDGPGDDPYEVKILTAMGIGMTVLHHSAEALKLLQQGGYDLLVSDIIRGGKKNEGFRFLDELREKKLALPTIFYISNFDSSRGVPPYAFGITNEPHELIHLILDALERKLE